MRRRTFLKLVGGAGAGLSTFPAIVGAQAPWPSKPVKIVDLARQMIRLAGQVPDKDIAIAFTGLRPGEKLYEEVLHESEDLVRAEAGLLLASPRTADHKLLERSFAEIERLARAGQIDEMKALLGRLVPEYAPEKAGAAAASARST